MWQIFINGPGYFDTPYDLPEGETHLGRADENDVVLTGDKVSRRHARIRFNPGSITVEDLGSRNGTQVNGEAVKGAHVLRVGDTIGVGENTLLLKQPTQVETARTELYDAEKHSEASPEPTPMLDKRIAELAGQVVLSRDLRENAFLASFDQAAALSLQELAEPQDEGHEVKSLVLLYKVVDTLSKAPTLDAFLQQMLDMVMELSAAKTGVVLLKSAKGTFNPVVVRHSEKLEKGEVPISDSVVAEVVRKKVALCVADVKDDARFANRESVILYDVNQVLCVPLVHEGGIIGVLYLNRSSRASGELSPLLDLLTAIAQLAANGAQQARLKARVESEGRMRRALERFHAPDIVDRVVKDLSRDGTLTARVDETTASILFADISGFTPLTEELPALRVVDLLNDFYRRMTRVIFSHGGTVDKFIGDSVMAIFGAPYSKPDDASRAVRAALAIRREFALMVASRPPDEICGIKVAVHTGKVLAGIVGSEARLEYTALGDAVNVAARLEGSALPGQVLITQATVEAAGERFHAVPLGDRVLRGKTERVPVYEVLDEDQDWQTSPGV